MRKLTLLLLVLFITAACFDNSNAPSELDNLNIKYEYLIDRLDKKTIELDSLISEYNHGIDIGDYLVSDYSSEIKRNLISRCSSEASIIFDKMCEVSAEIKRISEINN